MRYVMVFSLIILNVSVSVEAMDAQNILLREFVLFTALAQPEVMFDNQSQKGYSQVRPQDKKFVVKNYSPVQRKKKDTANGKLCALRSNKR